MDLILIVLPAFLIFATGYMGQRLLRMDIKSISTMALYLMLPFLIFDTFYTNELNMDYVYMFVYTGVITVLLIGITFVIGKMMKADKTDMSAMMLGGIFPNSGNYGAPVVLFAFGSLAFDYAVVIMVIHTFFINSIGIFIASYGSKRSTSVKDAFLNMIRMPVLYGAIFGIVFQLLHINLPSTIEEGIGLVGAATIPMVMLILGMQLAEIKPQKFRLPNVGTVTVIRMVISPLIAVGLTMFMPVSETIKYVFIILAAMPVAANTTMLAVQFDVEPDFVSFTTLVTTLISLATIPLTLYLLQ